MVKKENLDGFLKNRSVSLPLHRASIRFTSPVAVCVFHEIQSAVPPTFRYTSIGSIHDIVPNELLRDSSIRRVQTGLQAVR
jgi:hypothetical protein